MTAIAVACYITPCARIACLPWKFAGVRVHEIPCHHAHHDTSFAGDCWNLLFAALRLDHDDRITQSHSKEPHRLPHRPCKRLRTFTIVCSVRSRTARSNWRMACGNTCPSWMGTDIVMDCPSSSPISRPVPSHASRQDFSVISVMAHPDFTRS